MEDLAEDLEAENLEASQTAEMNDLKKPSRSPQFFFLKKKFFLMRFLPTNCFQRLSLPKIFLRYINDESCTICENKSVSQLSTVLGGRRFIPGKIDIFYDNRKIYRYYDDIVK